MRERGEWKGEREMKGRERRGRYRGEIGERWEREGDEERERKADMGKMGR